MEVVFATDSSSTSKADNCMRLLMGYCSEAKSTKKVTCNVCQAQRMRPAVEGADLVYKTCFDFEGVHCARDTRPACKLVMCKVFDGLLPYGALGDAALDCRRCSACVPPFLDFPLNSLVKYKGANSVFLGLTPAQRCKIREVESLMNHTVQRSSLSLVSALPQPEPPNVEKNTLRRREKAILLRVLEQRFLLASSQAGMLLSSLPSSGELAKLARWSAKDCAIQCSVRFANTDMEAWFESAQGEARRLAKSEIILDADVDNDCADSDEDGEAAEEAVLDEAEVNEQPVAASVAQQMGFVLDASFQDYLQYNLSTLRAAVAEGATLAERDLSRRRRLRQEEEEPVGTPVANGRALPKSGERKEPKQRRNTIN